MDPYATRIQDAAAWPDFHHHCERVGRKPEQAIIIVGIYRVSRACGNDYYFQCVQRALYGCIGRAEAGAIVIFCVVLYGMRLNARTGVL